jgi:hypothetical protein
MAGNIALCICTTFSLAIPRLLDNKTDSVAWLLGIVLQWTSVFILLLQSSGLNLGPSAC